MAESVSHLVLLGKISRCDPLTLAMNGLSPREGEICKLEVLAILKKEKMILLQTTPKELPYLKTLGPNSYLIESDGSDQE
jgi:hypothetical protein